MTAVTSNLRPVEQGALRRAYARADVILEYGAGASTVLAAQMPGKLVVSVEPGWQRAALIQRDADRISGGGTVLVHPVAPSASDASGQAQSCQQRWAHIRGLAFAIWDHSALRQPDVVFVSAAMPQVACLIAVALKTRAPVNVLVENYSDIHQIERDHVAALFGVPDLTGKLAHFVLTPDQFDAGDLPALMGHMARSADAAAT